MVKVKICGITSLEDAWNSCIYDIDYLGFIFVEGTPRCLLRESAIKIIAALPKDIKEKVAKVALFKDEEISKIAEVAGECHFEYIQLHGEESPEYCKELKAALRGNHAPVKIIKAFKVADDIMPCGDFAPGDYKEVDLFVFDSFHPAKDGGTGKKFDWEILKREKENITKPFFIAGGLNPSNVAEAVKIVQPFGVDVSSGVEIEVGKKDGKLLKEFVQNAKEKNA